MSTLDRIRHHDNRLKGPVLYTKSHLNRGFKQVVGLLDSLREGRFNQIDPLTLFTKINVHIRDSAKLKIAWNAVLSNND